jgi:hypothetical protein
LSQSLQSKGEKLQQPYQTTSVEICFVSHCPIMKWESNRNVFSFVWIWTWMVEIWNLLSMWTFSCGI